MEKLKRIIVDELFTYLIKLIMLIRSLGNKFKLFIYQKFTQKFNVP